MNLNQFRKQFPNETSCRKFVEPIRWPTGRICPHCGHNKSWFIRATAKRPQRYECAQCSLQFTVTIKTALYATKLPLSTWLMAMYLITSSSMGIASTVLARLIGTTQPTAWKIGHTVRKMMDSSYSDALLLKGIVELDEKYVGGKPTKLPGVRHKRRKRHQQEMSAYCRTAPRPGSGGTYWI